ncbi:MAG: DUF4143 domain-containing protein [Propionibacteriaceae bacterium]|jgi:predicted AAA+ superfamily ATPase|nr:DUF4143 domain-containing protein [Propionibacteriaceae bacterium]
MDTVADYHPRIADGLLAAALKSAGAAQIVGPKWCGKTTTAERAARSAIYLQDPDRRADYARLAGVQPSLLLEGERPRLIDEWQDQPVLWDAVRFAVDRGHDVGQFILTGSSIPAQDEIRHTGTGRVSRVVMRPMSLAESGESNRSVSLRDIFDGADVTGQATLPLDYLALSLIRGGWPASVVTSDEYSAKRAADYADSIAESDISRVDGIDKNPRRVRLLLRSLARNESTEAAMTTLRADMAADDGVVSVNTIAVYLAALRRLYVLEDQEPWAPAVRSKVVQRTSPIRRFCDPSIPAALLRLTPDKLVTDFNTFGLLFESLCVRDLRTYAEAADASVWHYRDARGLECDAIIEHADGRWGAVEIKLDKTREDEAAANLLRLQGAVRSQHAGPASFLLVLTADGYAYRRPDGVYSVPISCLGP